MQIYNNLACHMRSEKLCLCKLLILIAEVYYWLVLCCHLHLWYWQAVGGSSYESDFTEIHYHLSQALPFPASALCQLTGFTNPSCASTQKFVRLPHSAQCWHTHTKRSGMTPTPKCQYPVHIMDSCGHKMAKVSHRWNQVGKCPAAVIVIL